MWSEINLKYIQLMFLYDAPTEIYYVNSIQNNIYLAGQTIKQLMISLDEQIDYIMYSYTVYYDMMNPKSKQRILFSIRKIGRVGIAPVC